MSERKLLLHKEVQRFKPVFLTFIIGWVGGFTFSILGTPLPWLIGAMIAVIAGSMIGFQAHVPSTWRRSGLLVIGLTLGLYFTPSMGSLILQHLWTIIAVAFITIILGFVNSVFYHKLSNSDWITAIFGSIPGGLSQMVLVGKELGGSPQIIAILQSVRILFVVIIIPFTVTAFPHLSGSSSQAFFSPISDEFFNIDVFLMIGLAWVGRTAAKKLNFPAHDLIGALMIISLITVSGFSLGEIPDFFVHMAQLLIGISIGAEFKKEEMKAYGKAVAAGLLSSLLLVSASMGLGYLLMQWMGGDIQTAILSTAPGGIAEMSITALAVGANVALVTAFQVCRMIFAVVIVPKVIQVSVKRHRLSQEGKHMENL
jgi:membrane AbrB-like protein